MRAVVVGACAAGLLCLAVPQQAAGQAVEMVPSDWGLVPAGVSVGESFRLLFVSSTARDATSPAIGDYDTHVQSAAASSNAATDVRSSAARFSALASTSAVDARDHTSTTYPSSDKGVPVYWLGGEKVADDYEDFFSGDWNSNVPTDESGTAIATSVEVFTGSSDDGTRIANLFLGAAGNAVRVGNPGASGEELDSGRDQGRAERLPIYGLSAVYSVVADPAVPALTDARVDGQALTLTYSLTLDSNSVPATGKFTVTVAGAMRPVSGVSISGTAVMLTLAAEAAYAETVTVSYTPGSSPVQTATGRRASSLMEQPARNNTLPVLSVADASVPEGEPLEFTVTLAPESSQTVTVAYETAGGTATEGTDFTRATGTLTFTAGETTKTITVNSTEETDVEARETFLLTLNGPTNATLAGGGPGLEATGMIRDDDRTPGVEVSPLWGLVPPGLVVGDSFRLLFVRSGATDAISTEIGDYDAWVQRAAATGHTDVLGFSTHFKAFASTLAVEARDHAATSTTASDPGVPIYWLDGEQVADDYNDFYDGSWDSNEPRDESGNGVAAAAEVFTGSNSDGTRFPRRYFGTVDGNAVRVGMPRIPGLELNGGRNRQKDDEYLIYGFSAVFTVSASTVPTMAAAAVDGVTLRMIFTEPLAPSSVPATGDFSVTEGGVSRSVASVSIDGPTVTLTLSSAVVFGQAVTVTYTPGSTPLRSPAGTAVEAIAARMVTNATLPVLSIAQAAASEGGRLEFAVTLAPATDVRVTVEYETSDGTATEGKDFRAVSGTLAFAAGDTEATITVDTEADEFDEGSETFPMTLRNPSNATLQEGRQRLPAAGTILDDEEPQAVAVPVGWPLAPSGLVLGDSFRLLFVSSTTRNGRTRAIGPYDTHVRTAAGAGHANVQSYRAHFRALGSTAVVDARDHTGTGYTALATGVPIYWLAGDQVADDYSDFYDGSWDSNEARDESGTDVEAGTDAFTGSNADGTKVADLYLGADEGAVRIGTAGMSGQELDGAATRPVTDELAVYGLSGVFTITAGMLSELSVSEGTVTEGGAVEFTVTLSPPSAVPVTVLYETSSGTATQGEDFEAASGNLQFAANDTQETVQVATLQDRSVEGGETFSLTLSAPLNAVLSGGGSTLQASGTIADDDIRPVLTMAAVDGAMLTLAYGDPLDPRSVPVPGDFSISVDGVARPLWRVLVGGSTVTLTLESSVTHGQAVSASYAPGLIPIQHTGGTDAEALTNEPVANSTPAETSPGTDRAALVALYNATGGPNWRNSENWRTTMPLQEWHGVETDSDGRVTSIDLSRNRLYGVVPDDLIELTRLREFSVAYNEACVPGYATVSEWLSGIDFDGAFCPTQESVIDIAFFYTPAASQRKGGARAMETYVEFLVAGANSVFASSGVAVRLSTVLIEEVDYDEGSDRLGTHRRRLQTFGNNYMDAVHAKRDQVGADLVHLVAVGPDQYARGVAQLLLNVSPKSSHIAFSVTSENSGPNLFAHELGHVMGVQHDRAEACGRNSCASAAYSYGYGYVNQRTFEPDAPNNSRWRTIMSYNTECGAAGFPCARVGRFSDPTSTFREDSLGIAGDEQTIDPDGPADSVRALNNSRETIARYRGAVAQYRGMNGERYVDSNWPPVPEGLGSGDSFRLLFVTSETRNGRLGTIETYDAHVQESAASGHASIRAYSSHFKALASTETVGASDHTGTNESPGVPIYWLGGAKVTDNYSAFYDGAWDSNVPRNESGSTEQVDIQPFTGSSSDGTKFPDQYLGTTNGTDVRVGDPGSSGDELDGGTNRGKTAQGAFYGLSGVFMVTGDSTQAAPAELTVAKPAGGNGGTDMGSVTSLKQASVAPGPHMPPELTGASETGPRDPKRLPMEPSDAKVAVWTDRTGYVRGQSTKLYRSLNPEGDDNEYTFFYYLEDTGTGQRLYFSPATESTSLNEAVVDHLGLSAGAFQASPIVEAKRELIWAGAVPRSGSWRFVAEIRSPDGTQPAKTAYATVAVSDEQPTDLGANGQATIIETDKTWTRDTIYRLLQPVRVRAGATLTIEAGTLIQGLGASVSIVVERGGRIEALGTRARPVVMTCDAPVGQREPGCWGGLVVLGNAPASNGHGPSTGASPEAGSEYGGDDPNHSSGTLHFVRVEFAGGGSDAAAVAFRGVGSGTAINYVQAHESAGDGIEFRGGTANCRYCVSSGARDDALEWSEGWLGTAQHVFLVQGLEGDNGIEATGPEAALGTPGHPALYNLTLVGGATLGPEASSGYGFRLGAGAEVTARNLVVTGFGGFALGAESEAAGLFTNERSSIRNAILYENRGQFGLAQIEEGISPYVEFVDADPQLRNVRYEANPDPRPRRGSAVLETDAAAVPPSDGSPRDGGRYVGAFGETNWLEEWTFFGL